MKVLFTGTRRLNDPAIIERAIDEFPIGDFELWIHGDGPGTEVSLGCDKLVDGLANDAGIPVRKFPADWTKLGKSAGPIRNSEMVKFGADICLAFPDKDSVGTWDCLRKAVAAGIPVRIYPVKL
jgi:hypothetical protein